MIPEVQEFVAEKAALIAGQVARVRHSSIASAREVARGSAGSIRTFRNSVRAVTRSTIKLTTVSQTFSQNLLELQGEMVTSAISDVAHRLERAARAESLRKLVRDQIDLVPATRTRLADEAQRAVRIFKDAGRDVRNVASQAIGRIAETTAEVPAARTTPKRRSRKTTGSRRPKARARKAV